MLVTCGAGTVKLMEKLLPTPPTKTNTAPLVAVAGTVATMVVSDQLLTAAPTPLNRIPLVPCAGPNPCPVICTCVPVVPLVGLRAVTVGFGMENTTSRLLANPFTMTRIGPVRALAGTVATICVSLQLTTVAVWPLKAMEPNPWAAWKPDPLTVTCVPTTPLAGKTLLTWARGMVKLTFALLPRPLAETCTGPEVAPPGTVAVMAVSDQFVTVAFVPLKFTVPWLAPNPVPLIWTCVNTAALVGERPVMAGNGTKKFTDVLLEFPPTVTFTGPVAVISPSDHAETAAFTPLNVMVLPDCEAPKPLPLICT